MKYNYSKPPYKKKTGIPQGYGWTDMNDLKGAELEEKYKAILEKLGGEPGILGKIFFQANNKISNASILYRIVQILQIFSKSATKEEVIEAENRFKEKLGSRVFGLNAN